MPVHGDVRNKTGAYIPNYPDRGRFNRELVRNKTGAYIPNYPDRGRSLGSTASRCRCTET